MITDDGVYTFPVFTQRFCGLLLEELENIEQSICPKGRPNTMNQFGVGAESVTEAPSIVCVRAKG